MENGVFNEHTANVGKCSKRQKYLNFYFDKFCSIHSI